MPELPDVEYMLGGFKQYATGKSIDNFNILDSEFVALSPSMVKKSINSSRVKNCERRGKYILIYLDSGFTLVLHMGMTGWVGLYSQTKEIEKHDKFRMVFKAGKEIRYNCPRKLGKIRVVVDKRFNEIQGLNNLGIEPLNDSFTLKVLKFLLQKTNSYMKSFFMDQSYIAGIGNIYADEILFRSKILPRRKTKDLKSQEVKRIYKEIKNVLREAIENYQDIKEEEDILLNRRKKGKKCPTCKKRLEVSKIGSRTTYYCNKCQN